MLNVVFLLICMSIVVCGCSFGTEFTGRRDLAREKLLDLNSVPDIEKNKQKKMRKQTEYAYKNERSALEKQRILLEKSLPEDTESKANDNNQDQAEKPKAHAADKAIVRK